MRTLFGATSQRLRSACRRDGVRSVTITPSHNADRRHERTWASKGQDDWRPGSPRDLQLHQRRRVRSAANPFSLTCQSQVVGTAMGIWLHAISRRLALCSTVLPQCLMVQTSLGYYGVGQTTTHSNASTAKTNAKRNIQVVICDIQIGCRRSSNWRPTTVPRCTNGFQYCSTKD
ncbi:hypothetical protein [Dactylosporangium cerinum]